MILVLKIKLLRGSNAINEWSGLIEIDDADTLEDLHFAIQDAVGFDNDHLYEFFVARTDRSGDKFCYDEDGEGAFDATLASLYPLPDKRHLYYWFDFGADWIFQVTKTRKTHPAPEPDVDYPRLIQETGTKPQQYPDWDDEEG